MLWDWLSFYYYEWPMNWHIWNSVAWGWGSLLINSPPHYHLKPEQQMIWKFLRCSFSSLLREKYPITLLSRSFSESFSPSFHYRHNPFPGMRPQNNIRFRVLLRADNGKQAVFRISAAPRVAALLIWAVAKQLHHLREIEGSCAIVTSNGESHPETWRRMRSSVLKSVSTI